MGSAGPRRLEWDVADPYSSYHVQCDRCWSNSTSVRGDRRKTGFLASRLSRSLTVIGTDTDRLGTSDFLLTSHCNHGPAYTVSKILRYIAKSAIFATRRLFNAPVEGFPLEFFDGTWAQTVKMMGLPGQEKV